ncbi:hypothetical protein QPK24_18625 [Paenibacillus polygoni]|uniref:Spore coat protein B n=1 Tax=Paenibacillus polygoni TaxID=3050112 RepID=A0ABY8X1M5_9BACL|nr:hypothetical protein [Paenibacillus polygoni]WIV18387.1 hypothetical protein QPK24_18625 [Paenibacillus polygoni]
MTKKGQSMRGLLGKVVKINRGGPESFEGTLVKVSSDYMVIRSKEGFIYVNEAHVKSVTEAGHSHREKGPKQKLIHSNDFQGVLKSLRLKRVQINQGGPEKLEGVLVSVSHNRLIIILKNNEIVRVFIHHVKTISVHVHGHNNENQENKDNQSKDNKSNDNKAKDNKSNDNQARGNQSAARNSSSRGKQSGGNQSRGAQAQGNRSAKRTGK